MLDETDRRILRTLQADGRITNQALADACHISPAACFDRVKRLRTKGYILGTMAVLDPALLDRALLIFVEVVLDRTRCSRISPLRSGVIPRSWNATWWRAASIT